jgi:hypothetical protein
MTPTSPTATRYDSLSALREAHAGLLRDLPAQDLTDVQRVRVLEFLERGAATGAVIDAPADRRAAQGLLDYWKATLYTQRRDGATAAPLPKALLRDFDEKSTRDVADAAERYVSALPLTGQEVVRHLLLALVKLKPDASGFVPASALRGQLSELGPQAGSIVSALETAGMLRPAGGTELAVELASESLLRQWPRLANWLEQRRRLRGAARFWDQRGRPRDGLLLGPALQNARTYRDLDALERAFLDAASQREMRYWKLLALGAVALATVAIGFAVYAYFQRDRANSESLRYALFEKRVAEEKQKVAEERRLDAEIALEKLKKASKAAQDAKEREDQAKAKQQQIERTIRIASLLRALGDVALAETTAEKKLARRHWDVVVKRASNDPKTADALRRHTQSIDEIIKDPKRVGANIAVQSNQYHDLRLTVLHLAHDLRNQVLDSKDAEAIDQMKELRNDYYGTVDLLTAEITTAAGRKTPLSEILPYTDEFWKLYWGEMGMVESSTVETAMKEFGDVLSTWEKRENRPAGDQLARDLKTAREKLKTLLEKGKSLPLERAVSGAKP